MPSLITLSEMQTYLGIPAADTNPTMNLGLATYVSAVSEWLETMMGRTIALTTYTSSPNFSFYDGYSVRGDTLRLKAYPIGTVTALYDSPTLTFVTTETSIYNLYYVVDYDSGIIKLINGFRFSKGYRNIRVDYTAGYTSTPEDIKLATKIIVKELYKDGQTGLNNTPPAESIMGNWIESNHFVKTIINKYRVPTV